VCGHDKEKMSFFFIPADVGLEL